MTLRTTDRTVSNEIFNDGNHQTLEMARGEAPYDNVPGPSPQSQFFVPDFERTCGALGSALCSSCLLYTSDAADE